MLGTSLRISKPHARRTAQALPAAIDPHLACDRRHEVLIASHRAVAPSGRSFWRRWFEERLQPGHKVF